MDISKIRNEILTEDEKMEIIAGYLENDSGKTLTINVGSTTYEYNGSEPVTVTILDGESMEF